MTCLLSTCVRLRLGRLGRLGRALRMLGFRRPNLVPTSPVRPNLASLSAGRAVVGAGGGVRLALVAPLPIAAAGTGPPPAVGLQRGRHPHLLGPALPLDRDVDRAR